MKKAAYTLAALVIASPVLAQTNSREHFLTGEKTLSLWACSILAGSLNNNAEAERLFALGYKTGNKFIEVMRARGLSFEDWILYFPEPFPVLNKDRSNDFELGRMFEAVRTDVFREISTDRRTAQDMYRKQNCSFLN